MLTNAFIGKTKQPSAAELSAALGSADPTWNRLLADLAQEYGVDVHEWKSYSPKWGWSLRVKRKGRTIVWLGPSSGSFTMLFILGKKAVQAARKSRLPRRVIEALNSAPKYPEGTGLRLKMKKPADIAFAMQLARIKLAN